MMQHSPRLYACKSFLIFLSLLSVFYAGCRVSSPRQAKDTVHIFPIAEKELAATYSRWDSLIQNTEEVRPLTYEFRKTISSQADIDELINELWKGDCYHAYPTVVVKEKGILMKKGIMKIKTLDEWLKEGTFIKNKDSVLATLNRSVRPKLRIGQQIINFKFYLKGDTINTPYIADTTGYVLSTVFSLISIVNMKGPVNGHP